MKSNMIKQLKTGTAANRTGAGMKLTTLLIAGMVTMPLASFATLILHGPTDYAIDSLQVQFVDTITSGELNGTDKLYITYTANNTGQDGWLTLTMNTSGSGFGDFTSGGVGAFLLRTETSSGPTNHDLYDSGAVVASDASVNVSSAHSVRITLSGFSANNEFTGLHNALVEVDHNASSFVTADASLTTNLDFGGTDNGLTLRLNTAGIQDVDNVTVFQAIPEPSSLLLLGVGGTMLVAARRRNDRA